MEEDWWGGDATQNSASDAPKEIVISGPGGSGNTLTGGINQVSEIGQNSVWGNADQQDSTRSSSIIWFLTGLILVPVLLGGATSFLSIMVETGGYDEKYSGNPVVIDNVTIDDRTFETYGFSVAPLFHHDFDDHSWWDLSIQGEGWYSWTNSYEFDDPGLQTVDNRGSQWQTMQASSWGSGNPPPLPEIYIRVDSDFVHVAFNPNDCSICGQPEYLSYYSEDYPENEELIVTATCLLWPVTIIGGIIWGYATGRRPFAYGLMSFVAVLGIGAILLIALVATAFGW